MPFTEQRVIEVQPDEVDQAVPSAAPDDRPEARAPLTASTSAVPPPEAGQGPTGEDPSTAPQCEIQRSGSSTGMDITARIVVGVQGDAVWSFPGRRPMVGGEDAPLPDRSRSAAPGPFSTRRPGPAVREVNLAGPRAPRARARHGRRASGRCRRTKAARPGTGGARTGMRSARPATLPQEHVAAWRVACGVPMAPLPFLRPEFPLRGPEGFEAAAAQDVMVAGDGGYGLAPLGDELEDAVEQPGISGPLST